MNSTHVSPEVLFLGKPFGTNCTLPVLYALVHGLNVSLNFVIIGEGFVAFRANVVVFTAFSFITMDKSDVCLQLLDSSMADGTFFLVYFFFVVVNDVYVFFQISAGSKLFIAFITFMTLN